VNPKSVHFCSQWVHFCAAFARLQSEKIRSLANMFKMEQISKWAGFYSVAVKSKELTLKQTLAVPCPTCGAATKEACELQTGALRSEPHRDRKLSAVEAVEATRKKR
jgi:hypothetical protein